ncbi:glycosyltransferase family protein [Acidiluteibacter ferrifornacis]|uniref:Glycosyltransferase subfamily 4-like N-terminal domain-containing protein n=1 Tax=Acidiluteibacter ferrifornacis TaxID=2692424 RepID=A0A6N9NJL3_9FLAO|nr:glycosyltransferase family 4 protein [Acidiluteibacter ferrifornacis]NBG65377.1 hypothetical protein [Acidiluteibacter ferrifornacis]
MKILIISYYYPPCNSIASLRPVSWAKEWTSMGHEVTVVTRNWEETDNKWPRFIASSKEKIIKVSLDNGFKVLSLPYESYSYLKSKLLRKINSVLKLLNGDFNYEIELKEFYKGIRDEIKVETPDLIVVTSPPLGLVKLGYRIAKEFDLKYIVDFRDYENHFVLNQQPKLSIPDRINLHIKKWYLKKWLKSASLVSVASKEFATYFSKNGITTKALEFTNGFEPDLFNSIQYEQSDKFTISIIGSILNNQEVNIFLDGFNKFITKCDSANVQINFIGGKNIPEMAEKWENRIPSTLLHLTERIDRKKALEIGKNSTLLFYPGWKNYKGMYSGKIFDYLALKRPILIAPSDNDVIERLILDTKSGEIANTAEEVSRYLLTLYSEWKSNGSVAYHGNSEKIKEYSRSTIANKMAIKIKEAINL